MTDYGSDISTFPDLDPSFGLLTGPRVVAEAVARRLMTPRGGLFYDPQYGFDLRALLNDATPDARLAAIASQVEDEALKDERVQAVQAFVTRNGQAGTLVVRIVLTLASGTFPLTLTIGQVAAEQQVVFGQ